MKYYNYMFIQDNVPLQAYSTMRLGGTAAYLSEVNDRFEIPKLLAWAKERQLPVLMVGDGSNLFWRDEGFPGLVLVNRIMRFEVFEQDETTWYLTVGAGENWDSTVARSVSMGLNGIAELSLIPGTAGATPVQNVGAYGREISEVLVTIEAYDTQTERFVTIPASEGNFGYRTSRFKTTDKGRYFITAITMVLRKENVQPPYYDAVQTYLKENNISEPRPVDVRGAVIEIRSNKLPDPKLVANNGSFFANPIIPQAQLVPLREAFMNIKYWAHGDSDVKVSAAWLIEEAGFKDFHDSETGMATWPKQPLVLVNEHANSTADLLHFKQKIIDAVQAKFGITLQQEPELLP